MPRSRATSTRGDYDLFANLTRDTCCNGAALFALGHGPATSPESTCNPAVFTAACAADQKPSTSGSWATCSRHRCACVCGRGSPLLVGRISIRAEPAAMRYARARHEQRLSPSAHRRIGGESRATRALLTYGESPQQSRVCSPGSRSTRENLQNRREKFRSPHVSALTIQDPHLVFVVPRAGHGRWRHGLFETSDVCR